MPRPNLPLIPLLKAHWPYLGIALAALLTAAVWQLPQVREGLAGQWRTVFPGQETVAAQPTDSPEMKAIASLQERLQTLESQARSDREARAQEMVEVRSLHDQYQAAVGEVGGVHDELVKQTQVLQQSARAGTGASTSGQPSANTGGKVNINTATVAELDSLPGIGPSYAQRIIDYRNQNGPFGSVDDLGNVTGIGDATIAKLRDLVEL